MARYEALYGRRWRSTIWWSKVVKAELIGPYLVHQAMEKVKVIQERLKTAQSRQKSYKDVRRRSLEFQKCLGDPSLIVPTENIGIKDNLSYEDVPIQILDWQVCKLRTKEFASFKVLWRNQFVKEATCKAEEYMKKRYPHFLESVEDATRCKYPLSARSALLNQIELQSLW
ncbi:uncharacterized protein [Solanum lycopersicum]|uniref:uncharacterized protein n=1 Tax=Solanum lycopersicum TaxID=4081 RepID=UPI00374888EB